MYGKNELVPGFLRKAEIIGSGGVQAFLLSAEFDEFREETRVGQRAREEIHGIITYFSFQD